MFKAARDCLNYLFWCLITEPLASSSGRIKKYLLYQGNVLRFLTCPTHHMQIYRLGNSLSTIFKVVKLPESSRRMSVLPENSASFALCLSPELRENSQWKWPYYWQTGISVTYIFKELCLFTVKVNLNKIRWR